MIIFTYTRCIKKSISILIVVLCLLSSSLSVSAWGSAYCLTPPSKTELNRMVVPERYAESDGLSVVDDTYAVRYKDAALKNKNNLIRNILRITVFVGLGACAVFLFFYVKDFFRDVLTHRSRYGVSLLQVVLPALTIFSFVWLWIQNTPEIRARLVSDVLHVGDTVSFKIPIVFEKRNRGHVFGKNKRVKQGRSVQKHVIETIVPVMGKGSVNREQVSEYAANAQKQDLVDHKKFGFIIQQFLMHKNILERLYNELEMSHILLEPFLSVIYGVSHPDPSLPVKITVAQLVQNIHIIRQDGYFHDADNYLFTFTAENKGYIFADVIDHLFSRESVMQWPAEEIARAVLALLFTTKMAMLGFNEKIINQYQVVIDKSGILNTIESELVAEKAGLTDDPARKIARLSNTQKKKMLGAVDAIIVGRLAEIRDRQILALAEDYLGRTSYFKDSDIDHDTLQEMLFHWILNKKENSMLGGMDVDEIKKKLEAFVAMMHERDVPPIIKAGDLAGMNFNTLKIPELDLTVDLSDNSAFMTVNRILRNLNSDKRFFFYSEKDTLPHLFMYGSAVEKVEFFEKITDTRESVQCIAFKKHDIASPFSLIIGGFSCVGEENYLFINPPALSWELERKGDCFLTHSDVFFLEMCKAYGAGTVEEYGKVIIRMIKDKIFLTDAHEVGHIIATLTQLMTNDKIEELFRKLRNIFLSDGQYGEAAYIIPSLLELLANLAPQGVYNKVLSVAQQDPQRAYRILLFHKHNIHMYIGRHTLTDSFHYMWEVPILNTVLNGGHEKLAENLTALLDYNLFKKINPFVMEFLDMMHGGEYTRESLEDFIMDIKKKVDDSIRAKYLLGTQYRFQHIHEIESNIVLGREGDAYTLKVVNDPNLGSIGHWDVSLLVAAGAMFHDGDDFLDLCCGKGIISTALGRRAGKMVATDISPRMIELAKKNFALNNVKNVDLRKGDLFETVRGEQFDVITLNPPSMPVPPNFSLGIDEFSLGHEGGDDGRAVIDRVIPEVYAYLKPGGRFIIGHMEFLGYEKTYEALRNVGLCPVKTSETLIEVTPGDDVYLRQEYIEKELGYTFVRKKGKTYYRSATITGFKTELQDDIEKMLSRQAVENWMTLPSPEALPAVLKLSRDEYGVPVGNYAREAFESNKDAWMPSYEENKKKVAAAAEEVNEGKVVVFGAAPGLHDIPLDVLLRFKEIVIVDFDVASLKYNRKTLDHDVRFNDKSITYCLFDITGKTEVLVKEAEKAYDENQDDVEKARKKIYEEVIPDILPVKAYLRLAEKADFVISPNMLASLYLPISRFIKNIEFKRNPNMDIEDNLKYSALFDNVFLPYLLTMTGTKLKDIVEFSSDEQVAIDNLQRLGQMLFEQHIAFLLRNINSQGRIYFSTQVSNRDPEQFYKDIEALKQKIKILEIVKTFKPWIWNCSKQDGMTAPIQAYVLGMRSGFDTIISAELPEPHNTRSTDLTISQ